jgi:hypothetical protein
MKMFINDNKEKFNSQWPACDNNTRTLAALSNLYGRDIEAYSRKDGL